MASLKKTVQETLSINGLDVAIRGNGDENDYISLTDLAREKVGPEGDPRFAIGNWMRLKDTIALLGIWEKLNNPDFKRVEFDTFMGEAGRNAFTMTPSRWITATNAIGIQSRRGRNGGTFAHVDLALDFAAMNYRVHTDAIKDMMPPHLSRNDQRIRYAQEGDVLNIAVFGRTARQWRDANPNAKGNMRDYASITQNLVLSNLENLNAEMIRDGKSIRERMLKLNEIARRQMELFNSHPTVRKLEAEEHHHIEKPEVNENDDLR